MYQWAHTVYHESKFLGQNLLYSALFSVNPSESQQPTIYKLICTLGRPKKSFEQVRILMLFWKVIDPTNLEFLHVSARFLFGRTTLNTEGICMVYHRYECWNVLARHLLLQMTLYTKTSTMLLTSVRSKMYLQVTRLRKRLSTLGADVLFLTSVNFVVSLKVIWMHDGLCTLWAAVRCLTDCSS